MRAILATVLTAVGSVIVVIGAVQYGGAWFGLASGGLVLLLLGLSLGDDA